jgi:8-oxo-dGTP diphosphatase
MSASGLGAQAAGAATTKPPTRTLLVSAAILIDASTKKVLLAERPKGCVSPSRGLPARRHRFPSELTTSPSTVSLLSPLLLDLLVHFPISRELKGTFEFPGGKVEPSVRPPIGRNNDPYSSCSRSPLALQESPEEALVRELHEELGIIVDASDLTPVCPNDRSLRPARPLTHANTLTQVTFASHGYEKFHLLMPLYATTEWKGSLGSVGLEGQRLVFVTGEELEANAYPMPPADAPLIPEIIRFLNR